MSLKFMDKVSFGLLPANLGFSTAQYFGKHRSMPSSNQIAAIAAAMGDPVRINMLLSLRYDGVLTATELAGVGNVAPSTASEHLAKLLASNLVVQQKMGRQRLYSLADVDVCDLVDGVTRDEHKIGERQDRMRTKAAKKMRMHYTRGRIRDAFRNRSGKT